MIKFDEFNMGILDSLENESEAAAYICFLYVERARHKVDAEKTREIQLYPFSSNDFNTAWIELWRASERRHLEDIEMIDLKIQKIRERFNLEEK